MKSWKVRCNLRNYWLLRLQKALKGSYMHAFLSKPLCVVKFVLWSARKIHFKRLHTRRSLASSLQHLASSQLWSVVSMNIYSQLFCSLRKREKIWRMFCEKRQNIDQNIEKTLKIKTLKSWNVSYITNIYEKCMLLFCKPAEKQSVRQFQCNK